MVDLHSHILPGIDDGAQTDEQAIKLIELELENGVDTVALTPHFFMGWCTPEVFLETREALTDHLQAILSARGLEMKLIPAAEVRLSPELLGLACLNRLCYAGTDYMLVELPTEYYYDWIPKTLAELRQRGITPVLAHVERYYYFLEQPQLLADLVNEGAVTHVNARSLVSGGRPLFRFVCSLIRRGLVQAVASDSHSASHKPPHLSAAMNVVRKKFGGDMTEYFRENAEAIADNRLPELYAPLPETKKFSYFGIGRQ